MIVLLGYTCSGKDTVCKELVEKFGYEKLVTYTTRPMREGEIDGETYHFLSEEDFKKKVEEGFFLEHRAYHTVDGDWYYGTSISDCLNAGDKTVAILSQSGFFALKELVPKVTCVLLFATLQTLTERAEQRGDKREEVLRRLASDIKDLNGVLKTANIVVLNDFKAKPFDVAKNIVNYVEKAS